MSIVLLPLAAIPVFGPLVVGGLLFWIWRAYFRGRSGKS